VRRDVGAQQVAVEPDGLGPEARPFLDPRRAEVRDQDRTRIWVYPVVAPDLGFFQGEPDIGVGLGGEGLRGRSVGAVRAGVSRRSIAELSRIRSRRRRYRAAAPAALAPGVRPWAADPARRGEPV
jgi:hypothetical protein